MNTLERLEEVTPVMTWLWEKKLFDSLRKIHLFYIFRKRKTFTLWKKNIREDKQEKAL
jgi:hypothetical protein